jgi:hypothetical protein
MLRKLLASLGLSLALGISLPVFAANPPQPRAGTRITEPIDGAKLVKLTGSTHPLANAQNDRGAVAASVPLNRMMLVLKRPAAQDKALAEAIKEMQRPGSATFHHWLTAEQIGAKYGPAQEDINKVSSWLTGSGFNVTSISRARGTIEFSGTAGQVASAFQTEIHHYAWQGATYTANAKDPSIPAALAPVVAGFVSLNNFPIKGAHTDAKVVKLDKSTHTWSVEAEKSSREEAALSKVAKPNLTTNNTNDGNTLYAVTPYDFATIYNLKPLWDAGIDGTGQQIAILAESDITPSDVDQFRSAFGLPAKKLNVIHNGTAPGIGSQDQIEASIDVEWAGATAKNATIDQVVSASTAATGGIFLSMTYAVDNLIAPVISESYETCESALGPSGNLFFYQTWQQAAAEGITVVVSSGDTGSAGCDIDEYQIAQNGLAVNGFASTPYNVAVGGTDFAVNVSNPTPYWGTTNDPTTQASALSYIPEVPWNNSCASSEVFAAWGGGSGDTSPAQWCDDPMIIYAGQGSSHWSWTAEGGGGGASSCSSFDTAEYGVHGKYCVAGYAKPDWQTGINGVPDDKVRDVPDVSFFASYLTFGSAYLYCMTDSTYVPSCNYNTGTGLEYLAAGGTSFGAPAFAGVVALVNQKTSSSQGLANYYLYSLAGTEFGSSILPNNSQTSACNASSSPQSGNSCVFYDVTEGTNAQPCLPDSWDCGSAPLGYAGVLDNYNSNPGYDLVTGLGSVNIDNLVTKWATASIAAQATTTTLAASTNLSSYGQPVTLSGKVTPTSGSGKPVGSVSILGSQTVLATIPLTGGAYSQAISKLLPGVYNITANYVGEGGFQSSVSAPVSVTIAEATPTTSLAISAANEFSAASVPIHNNQIPYGDYLVATATVQGASTASGALAPSGSVTVSAGGTTPSTVTLSSTGTAVYQVAASSLGSGSLTATYSGDTNYNPGPATTASYSVIKAATSTEAYASASTISSGNSVTLTANVASGSLGTPLFGKVIFTLNGAEAGKATLVAGTDAVTGAQLGTATLAVPASQLATGTNLLTATFEGDTYYYKSTSGQSSFANLTGQYGTAMTLTTSATTATNTTPVTILATLTLNGAPVTLGTVSFSDNGKVIAVVPVVGLSPAKGFTAGTAKLVTRFAPGTHNITAVYSGVGSLIHPMGNGLAPITVTGSQITTTSISATSDAGTPANYDVTALVVAGGSKAPTGTLSLKEPSLNAGLNSVALNPSTAVYGPASEIPIVTGSEYSAIVTGDFNGDGILDYAALGIYQPTLLTVYLGKGDGTFKPGINSVVTADPTLSEPLGLATGDFNADGNLDVAVSFLNGNSLVTLLGKGDGTFKPGQALTVPPVAGGAASLLNSIAVADFNGDGIQDIALANDGGEGTASIEVYFGTGDGAFNSTPTVIANAGDSGAPDDFVYILAGDVNNDGNSDLVVFNQEDGAVGILLGNGDGTFQSEVINQVGDWALQGALGDLNNDGYLDIVVPVSPSQIAVLLNNQNGTFASPVTYNSAYVLNAPPYYYPEPHSVAIGDLNKDGYPDIVIANNHINQVSVLYGTSYGSFQQYTPWLVNTAAAPYQVVLGDLNSDGAPDILVNEPASNSVGVLINGWASTTSILNVPLNGATTEKETLAATYSGDSLNLASTSAALTLAGSGESIATKLGWSPAKTSTVFGDIIHLYVLNAKVENRIPGTITYTAESALGVSIPVTSKTILPAAGSYLLTATFTPTNQSNYAPSTASITFTVNKADVKQKLASSATHATAGASVTLTDAVTSQTTGTPTGVVTFYAGSVSLGSATLDSKGTASITTTSLPAGTDKVTASYLGDGNFNPGASKAIPVVIKSSTTSR